MAKSFKYKDNMYLDSTSVSHNKTPLNEVLNKMDSKTQLIKEVVLTNSSLKMELTNLSLTAGNYIIEIQEYSTTNSSAGHYVRINGGTSGYIGSHIYLHNGTFGYNRHTAGICLCNGWSMRASLCHTIVNLSYFNKDWISANAQMTSGDNNNSSNIYVTEGGSYNMHEIKQINKKVENETNESKGINGLNGNYKVTYNLENDFGTFTKDVSFKVDLVPTLTFNNTCPSEFTSVKLKNDTDFLTCVDHIEDATLNYTGNIGDSNGTYTLTYKTTDKYGNINILNQVYTMNVALVYMKSRPSTTDFYGIDVTKIKNIYFTNESKEGNTIDITDISKSPANSILLKTIVNKDDSTMFDIYIQSDGIVNAPIDSSNLFANLTNLSSIEFNNILDTSDVTNMQGMFKDCNSIQNITFTSFNTSKVTNMSSMFENCSSLYDFNLRSFDTTNVTTMANMFANCTNLVILNLSSFDTKKVTDMTKMFYSNTSITSIYIGRNWSVTNVTASTSMLYKCSKLPNGLMLKTKNDKTYATSSGCLTLVG